MVVPITPESKLLNLPPEILKHIFSFIYPEWHLNDFHSKSQPIKTPQRRYQPKLNLFQLPGKPSYQDPGSLSPFLICKSLHQLAVKAHLSSFTGHAHFSCDPTIWLAPVPWLGYLSQVTSISIDLSWCDGSFSKDLALRMVQTKRLKVYCYRDYCWRPQLPGIQPGDLDRMLNSDEFDELFHDEAVKSIEDNDGYGYVKSLVRWNLGQTIWCQTFDFGDEWDGAVIVEYGIDTSRPITSKFYDHWIMKEKRYAVL